MPNEQPSVPSGSYPGPFIKAFERVLVDEGSYTVAIGDSGGPTKFGISQRQYPELDIAALTRAQAAAIYYRDWWLRYEFGTLPEAIGAKLFNLAINMGPREATLCLQRALRACGNAVGEDGALGAQTRSAASRADSDALLAALRSEAAGHYRQLAAATTYGSTACGQLRQHFLRGWLNRAYE
ncbi:MAG TPA: glycosyl hydrolase 108 family protein [Candidatus Binataceae bacterium]|nr:glycosyl hydrolase 108 family protein [Candidatus Binataceae bacterium]